MALLACFVEVLKRERVPYIAFRHPPAYTAQERAAVSHIPGRCLVKVVICIADGRSPLRRPALARTMCWSIPAIHLTKHCATTCFSGSGENSHGTHCTFVSVRRARKYTESSA